MQNLKLPILIALGTLVIACSGRSIEEDPNLGKGGSGGGAGGLPFYAGGTGGGYPSGAGGFPAWCDGWNYTPEDCSVTGGVGPGGYGGEPGYPYDPAPPQPTEFSCCVIWAFCVHNHDFRCGEATLKITTSDRQDACDIWLDQSAGIGYESIPYCL